MIEDQRIFNLFNRLIEEPSKELFEQINVCLSNLSISKLADIVHAIQLDAYINRILENFPHEELLGDLSHLLTRLLQSAPPHKVIEEFKSQLIFALQHPAPPVKHIALKQLGRCSTDSMARSDLSKGNDLLCALVAQIGSEDLGTATLASSTILDLAASDNCLLEAFLSPPVSQELNNLMAQGDLVRFRVYEVIVGLASQSPQAMGRATEFLQQLLSELDSVADPLAMLNALELVTQFGLTNHGAEYLANKGVGQLLQSKVTSGFDDPEMLILLPSLLKYFGRIGQHHPQVVHSEFPKILDLILNLIEDTSSDIALRTAAIDCISMIGSSNSGKRTLATLGSRFESTIEALGNIADKGTEELRIEALIALSHIFKLQKEEHCEDLVSILEQWYKALGPDFTATLVRISKVPFPGHRCAAFLLVESIAPFSWGQKRLAGVPSFIEFLLDRASENSKDGHEARYAIVTALVTSPFLNDNFDFDVVRHLHDYYKEGPFFARPEATVAFEGST